MKIKLVGLNSVLASFDKVEKKLIKQVNNELAGAGLRVVGVAKMRLQPLPGDSKEVSDDIVSVRQSINFTHDQSKLSVSVFAGNVQGDPIAAYLEFGTGKYAARYVKGLPIEFQKLAMTFYKNGKGTLKEHPFLIPAFLMEGQRLEQRLKNLKLGW